MSGTAETSEFYFVPSSVRKSVCSLVRQLREPALQHVRLMQQAIEQCRDRGGVSEALAPIIDWTTGSSFRYRLAGPAR